MREIPLTNIYNYAFTYDHIVKQLFQKDYVYNISNPINCDDILLKLFLILNMIHLELTDVLIVKKFH